MLNRNPTQSDRLAVLQRYGASDDLPDRELDDIVQLAARICDMPVSLVTLVDGDRQHFKARLGASPIEATLDSGFCPLVVSHAASVVIPDAHADPNYAANPAVVAGGVRFYAGVPLLTSDGYALGTLCVIDHEPRDLDQGQLAALQALARQVMTLLELRRKIRYERANDGRLRAIFESAVDFAIVAIDPAGRITDWNSGAERILGWSADEVRGEPADRFITPEDRAGDRVGVEMRGALESGRASDERWHLRRDGARFWASGEMMPLRDAAGAHLGFLKILRDRTAERQAEASMLASETRLGALVRASSDVMYSMSADWNEMRRLTGGGFLADSTTANRDWLTEYIPPGEQPRARAAIKAAVQAKSIFQLEHQVRRADGSMGWTLSRAVPLFDATGEITEWFGTASDVTARREAEERLRRLNETLEEQVSTRTADLMTAEAALRQSQKMEAVGQLTGGLAHDFNNLLAGISGSLELMQTRIAQGRITDLDRYLSAAQGASMRAAALTHRLLAFSRRQTLDPKSADLNRLVAGMEELVRRTVGPGVTVETVLAHELWNTLVDPGQLENALLNLCINSRDAMPEGGRITIETGNKWLDEPAAREQEVSVGQYVTLCVSDTGVGMPPDVVARAFDPFFTTKPIGMGTGLGLSMIYGFTRQSGGQARIHSEVGRGTLVCLYLPRHVGAEDTIEPPANLSDAPRAERGETVLVVDDEPTMRMLVTEVLEELGYAAIQAADGISGLAVLRSDARIDLLVSDVGLPGGMNGRQMADAARELRPELKVLFITGYAENAVISHGHLGADMHVMTKPFAMEALATRIKEVIGSSQR